MNDATNLLTITSHQVFKTLLHNWPYLLASVLMAVLLRRYLDSDRIGAFLHRHQKTGVWAATAAAVGTPLCSCGTTAVVIGMMASRIPWAPVIAFMVASPLTSPQELVYSAGLFGWPFAWAFFAASILLGLAGGWVGAGAERRGWLADQVRFEKKVTDCSTGCSTACAAPRSIFYETGKTGLRLLLMFLSFTFVGHLINLLIPADWIPALFGGGKIYGIPLAATLGLPFYVNSEASLPLVGAMLSAGMSPGAALAFLITGAGTSLGAVTGALTIARWRVIGLVVFTLWLGAMFSGFAFNWISAAGLF
jgi:uncharacterized membrane protein YraQ (UPF0718 family)